MGFTGFDLEPEVAGDRCFFFTVKFIVVAHACLGETASIEN